MKKLIIASKNPVKIQAVKNGFGKMFPDQEFDFVSVLVPSNVASQPFGNKETLLGAQNRADNSSDKIKGADFYVGIEGGVGNFKSEMGAFAWIVIKSGNKYGKARTGTFFLPKKVAELIKKGKELGEVNDLVFKHNNFKQKNGVVGILTGDIINRTKYYTEAVILALIPFKNSNLY